MESNVCRVCMISSEVFEYCSLMEKKIFKNIRLCDAFKLITGLHINEDDGFPKVVCFRCEKQLQNAYHFRQLAESSSKHFALIQRKNSNNQLTPRILNAQKGKSETLTTHDLDSEKQWIEITNQNSQNMDVTLKSEVDADEETTCISTVVYMVDVNGTDGNIEVKPRRVKESSPSRITLNRQSGSRTSALPVVNATPTSHSNNADTTCEGNDDDQSEHSDAISFLLKNKHLKNHSDFKNKAYHNRKYECTVCSKKFVGKSNLIDHLRYHANIRNFKCYYCSKSFIQSGSLKSHLRTHTAEKPYTCCYCDKSFGQKSALTVHIRTHTQERNYVCETCSKAFMTTGDLIKHRLIHEPIKKFSCDVCGMRSAQKVNIKKHKLKVHGISEANL